MAPDVSVGEPLVDTLLDSEGNTITGDKKWYKIMLADGSELGYTTTTYTPLPFPPKTTTNCGPKPAGQGALFRFLTEHGDTSPWLVGRKGRLRSFAIGSDGTWHAAFMGLAERNPWTLQFSDGAESPDQVDCFIAYRSDGNRVMLVALSPRSGAYTGLRVQNVPGGGTEGGLEVHGVPRVPLAALDCQFVPCGPVPGRDWQF